MRETDKIAIEKFNGDIREAIHYIMFEKTKEEIDVLCEEWTKDELEIAQELIMEAFILKYGEENFKRMLGNDEKMELTDEDIDRAKIHHYSSTEIERRKKENQLYSTNPYKEFVFKDIAKWIVVNACILVVSFILEKFNFELGEWPATLCGLYTTMVALNLGPNIEKYFKFNNAKKHFDSNEKI